MAISDRYQDSLITRLKDPNYAAGYLNACLAENDPEPELIHLVFSNVAKAVGEERMTPEQLNVHQEKLDELLADGGSDVIYSLAEWLQSLGLKLTVQAVDDGAKEPTHITNDVAVTV